MKKNNTTLDTSVYHNIDENITQNWIKTISRLFEQKFLSPSEIDDQLQLISKQFNTVLYDLNTDLGIYKKINVWSYYRQLHQQTKEQMNENSTDCSKS